MSPGSLSSPETRVSCREGAACSRATSNSPTSPVAAFGLCRSCCRLRTPGLTLGRGAGGRSTNHMKNRQDRDITSWPLNLFNCINFLYKISRGQMLPSVLTHTTQVHQNLNSQLNHCCCWRCLRGGVQKDVRPSMRGKACTQPPAFCLFSKPRALQWRRATTQHEWAIPPGVPSSQQQWDGGRAEF